MTTQIAERLIVEHPGIDLEGFRLWAVVQGDLRQNEGWGQPYRARVQPTPAPTGGYSGPRTYVPFRSGRVIVDRAQWMMEPEGTFTGRPKWLD